MPKYKSTSDLYLGKKNGGLVKAGTVFEFAGKPGKNMVPVSEDPEPQPADDPKLTKAEQKADDKAAAVGGGSTGDKNVI